MPTSIRRKPAPLRFTRHKATQSRRPRAGKPVVLDLAPEAAALENAILHAAARDVAVIA